MKSLRERRVLVTGGAGFIGSHLCERLIDEGAYVKCFDNLLTGRLDYIQPLLEHARFTFIRGDLLNVEEVKSAAEDVEFLFHMAARVGVLHYVEDPIGVIETNVHGTENLLKQLARASIEAFVMASSSEVYGKNPALPLTENHDRILGPPAIDRWCYASSKALDEHLCNAYFRRHHLPTVILRYFNIYGPRQESSGYGSVVSSFIGRILRGEPPFIHGNGKQTRAFAYVSDAVEGTVRAATRPAAIGDTFNIGSPNEITISELAAVTLKLCGKDVTLKPVFVPHKEVYGDWYEDIPRRVPEITKAERVLGFRPEVGLEQGLARTIEWYRAQPSSEERSRLSPPLSGSH